MGKAKRALKQVTSKDKPASTPYVFSTPSPAKKSRTDGMFGRADPPAPLFLDLQTTPTTHTLIAKRLQQSNTDKENTTPTTIQAIIHSDGGPTTPSGKTGLQLLMKAPGVQTYAHKKLMVGKSPALVAPKLPTERQKIILENIAPLTSQNKKEQTLEIETAKMKKIADVKRRIVGQNQAIVKPDSSISGISAKEAAIICSFDTRTLDWEWGHLIGHRFAGAESQSANNLVLMTKHANTYMMFLEAEAVRLAHKYPDLSFKLLVKAELEEDPMKKKCHAAKAISYKIICDDAALDLTYDVDPYLTIAPPKNTEETIRALTKAKIDRLRISSSKADTDSEASLSTPRLR